MNDTTYPETTKTETTKAYSNGYAIYKPNQRGTGGVVRFNLNAQKGAVFVEAAAQSGDAQVTRLQAIIRRHHVVIMPSDSEWVTFNMLDVQA